MQPFNVRGKSPRIPVFLSQDELVTLLRNINASKEHCFESELVGVLVESVLSFPDCETRPSHKH